MVKNILFKLQHFLGCSDVLYFYAKISFIPQGGPRKHIKIGYEASQDGNAETSPGKKTKCTCSGETKTSGKKQK